MLAQIRYFQAIVRCGSFTEAAEQCHISQSAISQQIVALENNLGFKLFNRSRRKISLTEQGEYFYRKSLVLVADFDRIVHETQMMGDMEHSTLRIGYHITYGGEELQKSIAEMMRKYPNLDITIVSGNHEYLYEMLKNDMLDVIMSDQRRAFSQLYFNKILQANRCFIEISRDNPLSDLEYVEAEDLRNLPCIAVVTNISERETERKYIEETYGIASSFKYAPSIKDGRLMVVAGRGYLPVDGQPILSHFDSSIKRVPLMYGGQPVKKNLCLFWNRDNSGYYVEEFADILASHFGQSES